MFIKNPPSPKEVVHPELYCDPKWFDPKEAREKRTAISGLIDRFKDHPLEGEELENLEDDDLFEDQPLGKNLPKSPVRAPATPTVVVPNPPSVDPEPTPALPPSEITSIPPDSVTIIESPIDISAPPSIDLVESGPLSSSSSSNPKKTVEEVVEIDDSFSVGSEDETLQKQAKKPVPSHKGGNKEVFDVTSEGGDSDHDNRV